MYFKQILNERCGCASYVIASRKTREAAVIDPAVDTEPYDSLLRERDFRLRYVIDTHIHADHVSGARRLAAAHGAELCLHEAAQITYPFRPLSDGSELALGQLRLRVLHTPGHRPELISILIVNPPRSPEPSMVLICQGGFRSLRAAQFLRQRGFEDVVSVKGGTEAWRAAGKPLAQGHDFAEAPRVVETEWTHAGASTYVI